jgi:hypothetical protein
MRNLKMYCVEISNDGSEFELRFEINGEIVEGLMEYSFNDVLIDSYSFFKKNCEKYNFDSRFDKLEIDINYKY